MQPRKPPVRRLSRLRAGSRAANSAEDRPKADDNAWKSRCDEINRIFCTMGCVCMAIRTFAKLVLTFYSEMRTDDFVGLRDANPTRQQHYF